MVVVENLHKSFGDLKVLQGVSFRLNPGENLGILGKSGTGKSVLAKCIVRLLEPESGDIEVLGQDILAMSNSELNAIRKHIGYLFQGGALYDSMSIRENLEFPIRRTQMAKLKVEVDEMVERALRSVGLLDAINKMPSELSGGMKKRVGLARALILKPKLILYDEPTTGLDSVTSGEISELMVQVQEEYQAASIIITHDMKCAKITTNRLKVLDEGKFIADGTYNELNNSSDKKIRAFFM